MINQPQNIWKSCFLPYLLYLDDSGEGPSQRGRHPTHAVFLLHNDTKWNPHISINHTPTTMCPSRLHPSEQSSTNTGYLRATSHMRLRARDHYIASTLIGGKSGAGPSSLHTTLEGPKEHTNEGKTDVKSTWISTWYRMDHVSWSLGLFSKTTLLEVSLTQNHWETMNAHIRWFLLFYHV